MNKSPRRYARKVAKGIWWLATPWLIRQRMQALRHRSVSEARRVEFEQMLALEEKRLSEGCAATQPSQPQGVDLTDDADAAAAAGLPFSELYWDPVTADQVVDRETAARFLIDLWRRRIDIRHQFPHALSGGSKGAFALWLRQAGGAELGLVPAAIESLHAVLDGGFADRARQAFLANEMPHDALPHGLTPAGMRELFRWVMRHWIEDGTVSREEAWWLFLDAAEHPSRELVAAYAFAPRWQALHPDGLTVFGRAAFARWFADAYAATGTWLDPSTWPDVQEPATQLRLAWHARLDWRGRHPDALQDEVAARALVEWLSSAESPLDDAQRAWCARLEPRSTAVELARPGANVIGHFCYPSGLRVSVESMVQAMRVAGLSTSLRDVLTDAKDEPRHEQFRGMECHDVTIIHTQPEPFFDRAYARAHLYERKPRTYRIAYWYWEFDTIPDSWLEHVSQVDEVWTATEFVARGLRARLDIPVRTLFPGVKLARYERRGKAFFGLDEKHFTFLFTFHMVSVMERKNPLGLVRAFKEAFSRNDAATLVLKTSFGDRHPAQFAELLAAAEGANIVVIDEVYSPDKVLSLMDACDAYVSLHRSEGLGLTMAESMLMGKPVIATNFSGNVDFMDDSNSLLVPYRLVKLGKPIPPYDADLEWAEPSQEHAVELMRRAYNDQDWAREVGARGKASAETHLSLETAGRRIAARLAEIRDIRKKASS
ncbi:Group 1 glycosyl transferase [Burkholderiales bacterium 8X]|nr:Group 1 glycosyl transferase [Burkholderiales bacterium 8X]